MNTTPNKLFNITGGTTIMDGNLAMGNDLVNQEPNQIDALINKYQKILNQNKKYLDRQGDKLTTSITLIEGQNIILEDIIKDLKTL